MRFRFLGTGTSSGVPAIACDCVVCTSTDPHNKRLRTGASVEFVDVTGRERVVLIDTTPDLRQQALTANLRRCDAIVYTHNHVDHVFGLDEVRRFNAVQRTPIDVYAEAHTMGSLRRVYEHIFDADRNVNDSFVATLIAHEITLEQPLDLFGMTFTPVRLLHGRLPILGFRIEPTAQLKASFLKAAGADSPQTTSPFPLAYCTDVSAIPPESWRQLRNLETLVLDALRHRKHPTHFTLDEAVRAADQIAAKHTWFIHMSHDMLHAETNESLPEGMSLAHDGLVLGE
ncbi:MAG: MBL fold metallo-hydrolase [Pyrinomonadaceae bacterium]|nr:MBL fold metallo-hydrolase [Phycisphaerales bacterium]